MSIIQHHFPFCKFSLHFLKRLFIYYEVFEVILDFFVQIEFNIE